MSVDPAVWFAMEFANEAYELMAGALAVAGMQLGKGARDLVGTITF